MSWDVILLNLPPGTVKIEELPEDTELTLGGLAEVLGKLRATFGESLDLTDPEWGTMEGDNYSIEFNIGSEDPCDSIMLHVRGDETAIQPIKTLCAATGWRAFDTSTGELMDFEGDAAEGLRQWREFRDRVLPGAPLKGVKIMLTDGDAKSPIASSEGRRWWKFWK